jgi:hypothetical protein
VYPGFSICYHLAFSLLIPWYSNRMTSFGSQELLELMLIGQKPSASYLLLNYKCQIILLLLCDFTTETVKLYCLLVFPSQVKIWSKVLLIVSLYYFTSANNWSLIFLLSILGMWLMHCYHALDASGSQWTVGSNVCSIIPLKMVGPSCFYFGHDSFRVRAAETILISCSVY